MTNITGSKIAVDPNIAQTIPTVVVSAAQSAATVPEDKDLIPVKPPNFIQRIISIVMDFLETIVVALSIFVVVYLFLVQPHEVKGSSMEPNFHNNDYILTDKISLRLREPQRGDVVIFKAPRNTEVDYIKRVIGLPGDKIKISKGYVYLNGVKLNEYYLADTTNLFPGSYIQDGIEIIVPEGEFFVMGDNRPHSSDSREFGPIPANLIIGKAILRYWPPTKAGLVLKINY